MHKLSKSRLPCHGIHTVCIKVSSVAAVNICVAVEWVPYLRPRCNCVFYHMMEYGPIECKGG